MKKLIPALVVAVALLGFASPALAGGTPKVQTNNCVTQAAVPEMVRINPKLDLTSIRLCEVTAGVSASVAASVSAGLSVGVGVLGSVTATLGGLLDLILRILCLKP